jgi:tetratricopeptide (TPR) repeat protein
MSDHSSPTSPAGGGPTRGPGSPTGLFTDHLLSIAQGHDLPPAVPGYDIREEVGRGGMGVVYRATDLAFGRDVAVKLLQPQFAAYPGAVRRFADEARITGQLQHPGIPAAYHTGTLLDGRPFLAMRLIGGRTLDDHLRDDGADRGRLVAAFEAVCQAVAYAHSRGVVHRDLKPSNVMVGAFGEVQVMDWGLAKVLGGAEPAADGVAATPGSGDHRTQAGSFIGTPGYMAPEQAAGAVDRLDRRTDVFGLGAILCVVLTGKPPHPGGDAETSRRLAAAGDLGDALGRLARCGADPGLVALCRWCLAADKKDRPADAGVVAAEVARLRADADDRARRAEVARAAAAAEARAQRTRRRAQAGLGLGFTAAVVLAGGGLWWADRQGADRRAERAAAVDRAERAVAAASARAALLRDQFRYAEAVSVLTQAAELVPPDAPPAVRDAIARELADTRLAHDLDEIRFGRVRAEFRSGMVDLAAAYRRAFAARGVDPAGSDPAAADWVAGSPIRRALAVALSDWASVDDAVSGRLLAVARRADPAEWEANRPHDPATWPPLADLPPDHVALLLQRVTGPWPGSREALAAVAARHRSDFWVQYEIGYFYMHKARDPRRAAEALRAALAVRPDCRTALEMLAWASVLLNDPAGAVACHQEAVRLHPDSPGAHNEMAWVLATSPPGPGFGRLAVKHAIRACELTGWADPWRLNTLAAAYAAAGEFDKAIDYQRRALADPGFAREHGEAARERLALYEQGLPYRDPENSPCPVAPPPRPRVR